jgi:hypothetical protein
MARYSLRFGKALVPTVEVTLPAGIAPDPERNRMGVWTPVVVKRIRGLTSSHAMVRAQRWTREHGDPR